MELESCRQEKDILNNQLVQKLEEIGLLNEKINTMQIALNRGNVVNGNGRKLVVRN